MRIKFDFNLSAWVKNLEIYAKSVEDAEEELLKMTAEDITESGDVNSSDVSDLTYEIVEIDYTVEAYDIRYGENLYGWDYVDDQPDDVPNKFTFEISCHPDDLEDEIQSEIESKVSYEVLNFKYKILEEK